MTTPQRAEEMLRQYAYQKGLLHQRARMKRPPEVSLERLRGACWEHMLKAAMISEQWRIRPSVYMAAAFDRARRSRQPDGPFPALLHSSKYMLTALSLFLDQPIAAVVEGFSHESMVDEVADAYDMALATIKDFVTRAAGEPLSALTPVSPTFRVAYMIERPEAVLDLIPEALKELVASPQLEAWLEETTGHNHGTLAALYNNETTIP